MIPPQFADVKEHIQNLRSDTYLSAIRINESNVDYDPLNKKTHRDDFPMEDKEVYALLPIKLQIRANSPIFLGHIFADETLLMIKATSTKI